MTTHREVISTNDLTVRSNDVAGRNLQFIARLGDNLFGQTSSIVGLGTEGNTLDDVVELQRTSILSNDNSIEGVPLSNPVALLNGIAILEIE